MTVEGFSGYPVWTFDPSLALSVAVDVETYSYEHPDVFMVVSEPVRHRVIIEGTIERVAPYLAVLQKQLSLEEQL